MEKHPLATSVIEAKYYGPLIAGGPSVFVIHTAETAEMGNTAENVANYFKSGPPSKASTTWIVDNNSKVQGVPIGHVNHAAPGANHCGEHMELAGRAAQTAQQWSDAYSLAELNLATDVFAYRLWETNTPVIWLRADDLHRAGRQGRPKGLTSHAEVSLAWHLSDHSDPGKNFPTSWWVSEIQRKVRLLQKKASPGPELFSFVSGPNKGAIALFSGIMQNGKKVVRHIMTGQEVQKYIALGYDMTNTTGEDLVFQK